MQRLQRRIAIVTTSWPERPGDPAGHFVRASARALEAEGCVVDVVRPRPGTWGAGAFGWPGIAARVRERPLRALGAAVWVARARREVRALGASAVVAHWAVPSAWPIAVASGAPIEVVSHGGDVRLLLALPRPVREWIAGRIARRAVKWTFVSAALRDGLLAALGAPAAAAVRAIAHVQAPPLEMPEVREEVERLRRLLGRTRAAVSVGRLVPSKHVERAIEHVARSTEFDALVVVGDGPERRGLERLARERRVDARFVGAVERVEALAWIAAADALIHASTAEGLSTVVREAEALGTRVVRI